MKFSKNLFSDMASPDSALRKKGTASAKRIFYTAARLLVLSAIGYIIIYPLLQMIVTSVKDKNAFYDAARGWIPSSFNIKSNYSQAAEALKYWDGLKATLLYEMLAAVIEILTCAVTAYGFARFRFKFKGAFTACLFLTILIPETMLIIPRSLNFAHLDFMGLFGLFDKLTGIDIRPNIVGTPLAFWLPSLFSMGLRSGIIIYIYIQFFKSLPYELEEAAWVDGAGPVRTFVSIAVPSSSVVFVTVSVFSVIWHWNDNLISQMYLLDDFPLAVNLERMNITLKSMGYFIEQDVEGQALFMAACVLFLIPPLVLYMILQRKFIESIDRVGITG